MDKQLGFMLILLAGSVTLLYYAVLLYVRSKRKQVGQVPCPHGHLDWDDCPDCCH